MAQLKRSEIIALAIEWAGRKGQSVDLTEHFDFITDDMSKKYPLLRAEDTGNLTADQNYITLPTDYRSQELFNCNGRPTGLKVGTNWLTLFTNPIDIREYDDTEYGTPTLYAVFEDPATAKIYFYPKTEILTPAYKFLYFKLHPKAWKTWAGLAAKVDISFDAATKTIAQVAKGFDIEACRAGRELIVAGSASNDDTYTIVSATTAAVVVSEVLVDEAAGASVTITVESENDYLHLYGANWDHVVTTGLTWRTGIALKEPDSTEGWEAKYLRALRDMFSLVRPNRYRRVVYHDF